MKTISIRKSLLIGLTVAVLLTAFGLANKPGTPVKANNVLNLQAPPFVGVASAAADTASPASFLDDEAGISAYTQVPGPIDLSVVRDEFRTVERETNDYIIGSVGTPDYSEDHDPHVYVHTDGWVLAYYLNSEPASYIIDLRHYDGIEIGTTKLEDAIYEVLSVVGIVSFDATYYDFRYPNATHIMLIAEAIYDAGSESFDVYLPSDFVYYDKSWSHVLDGDISADSHLYPNDVELNFLGRDYEWSFDHDTLTTAQLPPAVSHTFKIDIDHDSNDAYCAVALVYQEVP